MTIVWHLAPPTAMYPTLFSNVTTLPPDGQIVALHYSFHSIAVDRGSTAFSHYGLWYDQSDIL